MIKIVSESINSVAVADFMEQVKSTYSKYFPHSVCKVDLYKNLGSSINIDCFLASNKHELINGYWNNDMFKISFNIELSNSATLTSELPENITLECGSHGYFIKPDVSYLAYGYRNIPFRKTSGPYTKCLSALDKFFSKLKTSVVNDLRDGNIHDNYKKLVRYKISG